MTSSSFINRPAIAAYLSAEPQSFFLLSIAIMTPFAQAYEWTSEK